MASEGYSLSQDIPTNFPVLQELSRRNQLDSLGANSSFLLGPNLPFDSVYSSSDPFNWFGATPRSLKVGILPILNTTRVLAGRPYGWADYGMIPNPGIQTYFSGGIQANFKFINLTFRPEVVIAQNAGFETNLDQMSNPEIRSKFFYWNIGDFPERFGEGAYASIWWGQSKLTAQYGAFEIGIATENIWWGPGQFNALTFSNNAQGFPHLTLNTTKPAKTPIGNFETQLIVGKLQNSMLDPSQDLELNEEYFKPFSGDWRYLNALMLSYNPKWVPGLFVGFSRTFQQYSESMGSGFLAYFPVLEAVTKVNYGFDQDGNGQDQQITVFGRWVFPEIKNEFYFEFGRRDHAYNWREFVMTPEHARAYILGFNQLFEISKSAKMVQVRAEITQQQESVNRYIRYPRISGGQTWHTHNAARGFVQKGQPLGVGIGVGSNVQTVEFALVDGVDKMGIVFERLANNQDFYYRAQLQDTERKPWIDLSLGFLYDKKFDNLLVSSKLQIIHAKNYQWQLDPASTPEFPKGENLTSMLAQVSLIYLWKQK